MRHNSAVARSFVYQKKGKKEKNHHFTLLIMATDVLVVFTQIIDMVQIKSIRFFSAIANDFRN